MTDYGDEPSRVLTEDKRILNETMHEFYQLLPYKEVEGFDAETASEGDLKDLVGRIDNAQDLYEQMEAMRLHLTSVHAEGELEDMSFGQLQRLAKLNRVNHRQSKNVLVAEMAGTPRTIRPWRQMEQLRERLRHARTKTNHLHPRQEAAMRRP